MIETDAIEKLMNEAGELCFNNHVPMDNCGCSEMIKSARAQLADLLAECAAMREALLDLQGFTVIYNTIPTKLANRINAALARDQKEGK